MGQGLGMSDAMTTPANLSNDELFEAIAEDSDAETAQRAHTEPYEAADDLEYMANMMRADTAERRAIAENLRAYAVELRRRFRDREEAA